MSEESIITQDSALKAAALLEELIALDTTCGNEQAALDLIKTRFADLGFEAELIPVSVDSSDPLYAEGPSAGAPKSNLIVRIPGLSGGKSVIMNAHIDTLSTGSAQRDGDIISGPGAADAKGQIAVMYALAASFKNAGVMPRGDIVMQIVVDGEIGGNGTLSLVRSGQLGDAAVVLAPTDNTVRSAGCGSVGFRIEASGRSVHMNRAREGVNAMNLAVEISYILQKYEDQLSRESRGKALFKGYNRPAQVCLGKAVVGDCAATVAGTMTIEGAVVFLPNKSVDEVKEALASFIQKKAGMWLREHNSISFPNLKREAFETAVSEPVVQAFVSAMEKSGLKGNPTGLVAATDAALLSKAGVPTIIFGPGTPEAAHTADEQISVADIEKAAQVLAAFVEMFNS
jgi:acetylornithine deacetylase